MHERQPGRVSKCAACVTALAVAGMAFVLFARAQDTPPRGAEWFNYGVAHAEAGRWAEAVSSFQKALQENPEYVDAWVQMGVAREHQGDSQRALACYERAVQIAPRNPGAWLALGRYWMREQNSSNALSAFQNAADTPGGRTNDIVRAAYVEALLQNNLHADARQALEDWLHDAPDNIAALGLKAEVLFAEGRFDEAAAVCRKALALKPDHADLWHNLGVAELRAGRPAEAARAFARAAQAGERSAEKLLGLGIALANAGRLDDAIIVFRELVRAHPQSASGWLNLGIAYGKHGWIKEAQAAFRQALALDPDSEAARAALETVENALKMTNTTAVYIVAPPDAP